MFGYFTVISMYQCSFCLLLKVMGTIGEPENRSGSVARTLNLLWQTWNYISNFAHYLSLGWLLCEPNMTQRLSTAARNLGKGSHCTTWRSQGSRNCNVGNEASISVHISHLIALFLMLSITRLTLVAVQTWGQMIKRSHWCCVTSGITKHSVQDSSCCMMI